MPAPGTLLLSASLGSQPAGAGPGRQTHLADAPTCSKQQVFRGMACAVEMVAGWPSLVCDPGFVGLRLLGLPLVNSTGSSLQLSDCYEVSV